MHRCRVCGRRWRGEHAGCPAGGPAVRDAEGDRAGQPTRVHPSVPGYHVEALLGWGGFAAVWRARRTDGTAVAIKLAHAATADSRRRASREAGALAAVGPPWSPALIATGALASGAPYVIMEHV